VVAAVIAAGSERAAAHRLGLSHSTVKHHLANARSRVGGTTTQLVWILAPRLPEPEGVARTDEWRPKTVPELTRERSASDDDVPMEPCHHVRTRSCRIVTDRRGRHHT